MKVITIAAPKGGSGKTTLTSALAVCASMKSMRVAIIDLNADQGNLTQWWMARGEPMYPRLFSDIDDITENIELLRLEGWDYVFIDTPPLDMDVIETSVMIADAVLVPVRASIFDIGSIDPIVEMCKERRKPFAFVMSAFDSKFKKLNTTAVAALAADGQVLGTRVSYRAPYINALTAGKTGPEIEKSLKPEIDGLWAEVQRLAGPVAETQVGSAA